LAREQQPELVQSPVWEPLALEPGERVARFFGETGAQIVDGDGARHAFESTLPLRSEVGDGEKRLVDLSLADGGGALEPVNPLIRTAIAKQLRSGVRIGGDGFALRLESPSSVEAEAVADRAFFANALPDSDMVVMPTPKGVQVSLQVRSEDAPEQAVLALDLPEGAALKVIADGAGTGGAVPGSAEIVRGDELLAVIQPPVGWDADNEPLEGVRYSAEGDDLVVHYPHRSADVLYPLVIDPQVDRSRVDGNGRVIANGPGWVIGRSDDSELAAWNYGNGGGGSHLFSGYPGQAGYTYEHNWVLALTSAPVGGTGYAANAYGQWTWRAPRQSWIFRADFADVDLQTVWPPMCLAMGLYSLTRFNWEAGNMYNGYGHYVGRSPWASCAAQSNDNKAHFSDSPTPGNLAVYQMFAYGDGGRARGAYSEMAGISVGLDDGQAPSVSSATTSPGGWVRSATVTTRVNTRDAAPGAGYEQGGLGMWIDALFVPVEGGGAAQQTVYAPCNKGGVTRITRCEEYADFSHTYSTEGDLDTATPGVQRMPEGVNTIYGDAYDAIGKPTRYQAGTVKIDRTPPSGTISGIGEGELARDRDYTITGTSADPLSGSRTVQITLDGVQKANRDDCPANDSSCELTWTLDGGDPALTEGTHTLRVNATDQVGNGPRTVATRSFRVERTPPTIDVEGSLKPEDSDWVARGEQDLLFDAFDEGGTGVTSAKLKVDGVTVQEAPAQSCEQGGCALSHDFYPTTDGFAPGEHEVSVEVTDGAGNVATAANAPEAGWMVRLERDAPSVALSGSLWDARGQTLEAGRTYALSAVATEPSGGATQSQLGALEFSVDGDVLEIQEQPCDLGACAMARTFEYVVDDFAQGEHSVSVTGVDHAGNEAVETFTVGNPSPPPLTCAAPVPGGLSQSLLGLDPVFAEQLFRVALPAAFGESSSLRLADFEIKPGLGQAGDIFPATGVVADTTFGRTASNGPTRVTETPEEPACVALTGGGEGASAPTLVDGAAALYANSHPGTDTLLRPSAVGSFAVQQIRDPRAPTAFSWDVDLHGGRALKRLASGAVAVVEPAEQGTSAPTAIAGLPGPPTTAERKVALTDTAAQVSQASDDLERAQGGETDRVLGVIAAPFAEDKLGNPVATSLAVEGSKVTMEVLHGAGAVYPVVAGHGYVSRDAVDEYETLRAAASIGDYAWGEGSEPAPSPTPAGTSAQPPAQPPAGESEEGLEDDGLAGGGDDDPADGPVVVGAGGPEASSEPKRADTAAVGDLKVGITANSAANIRSADFADGPGQPARAGRLNPPFVRPFAPWNLKTNKNPGPCVRFDKWRNFAAAAKERKLRVDLTINPDARLGRGGTANFTVREYGGALKLLLDDHGRKFDTNGTVIDDGIIDNLMAWNEPQYGGTKRPGKCGVNRGNPLKKQPLDAARLWFQAMAACFPEGPEAQSSRCGQRTADGTWKSGRVVAGEFVGTAKPYPLTFRGRRLDYVEHYRNQIERTAKRLAGSSGGHLRRMPRVWSFHDYGDFKRFAIGNRRKASRLPILTRFTKLYDKSEYEYAEDGSRRKPEIWMTEGVVNYRFNCESVGDSGSLERFCDNAPENISLLGMRRQAETMAFFLKSFADRPRVSRIYYYHLVTAGECNSHAEELRREPFFCPLSEFGLLGANDDDLYAKSTETGTPDFVIPHGGRGPIAPNNNRYSYPGERRFAFCLLRDRKPSEIRRPARINRASCPAGPS